MDKVKILIVAANPSNTVALALDEEAREIQRKIRASDHRSQIELITRWACRPDDLIQAMLEVDPDILHFSGHGSKSSIILQNDDGEGKPVSKAALVRLFRAHRSRLKLVVFNACSTQDKAIAVADPVGSAIGMARSIGDQSAIVFASAFYRAIGFGRTLQEAYDHGVAAIEIEDLGDTKRPKLHCRPDVDPTKLIFTQRTTPAKSSRKPTNPAAASPFNNRGAAVQTLAKKIPKLATLPQLIHEAAKLTIDTSYKLSEAKKACERYAQRYEARHGKLKFLGLSDPIPVASIYIEVDTASANSVNGYRDLGEIERSFVKRHGFLGGPNRSCQPGIEMANDKRFKHLNILGSPGAGKSTFLKSIGLNILSTRIPSLASTTPPPKTQYRYNLIPVLIELRDLASPRVNLPALIDSELTLNGMPAGLSTLLLESGAVLVLLDGLDEVDNRVLPKALDSIKALVNKFPDCRFITSCRTAFYKNYFERFTDVILTSFTDNQIKNLIENWFSSERETKLGIPGKLWQTLSSPGHRATLELARTPLLASFICIVFKGRQQLPSNLAELFRDALQILMEGWSASKWVHGGPVHPSVSAKLELLMLESVAGEAYLNNKYVFTGGELGRSFEAFVKDTASKPSDVDGREILNNIEVKQGLLVQRAHDRYTFSHLTLQEYLAASHYYKCGRSHEIARIIDDDRWFVVRNLIAGLQEPHADSYIESIAKAIPSQSLTKNAKQILRWAQATTPQAACQAETAVRRSAVLSVGLLRMIATNPDDRQVTSRNRWWRDTMNPVVSMANCIDSTSSKTVINALHQLLSSKDIGLLGDIRDRDYVLIALRWGIIILSSHSIFTPTSASSKEEAIYSIKRYLATRASSPRAALTELDKAIGYPFPLDGPCSQASHMDIRSLMLVCNTALAVIDAYKSAERVTKSGWDAACELLFTDCNP